MTTDLSNGEATSFATDMIETLGRIKVPKSSDLLAERLKQKILNESYSVGSSLPTERELVAATGLSRGSVREALRLLEAQGLVHTRAGRYGGSTVAQPTDDILSGHINLYARGRDLKLQSLVEVRQALEPMVAYLAALNRTDTDLEALRAITNRLDGYAEDDVAAFLEENSLWHDVLAAASHNELLRALAMSVGVLMLEVSKIENFASREVRLRVCKAHHRIFEAIEQGDGEAARRRTERDVLAYAKYLEALNGSAEQGIPDAAQ